MGPTSPRHRLFVDAYLARPDAKAAAIAAGYSAPTARAKGCELLKHPWISAEIARRQAQLSQKLDIQAHTVLQELAAIGFSNIADFLLPDGRINADLTDRAKWRLVKKIKVTSEGEGVVRTELELHDKLAALDKLGKHLGLFNRLRHELFDEPDDDAPENVPIRDSARALLFALATAMKAKAGDAAKAAAPTKH